jgi:hypothetical protein
MSANLADPPKGPPFLLPESLRRTAPWDSTIEIGSDRFEALTVPSRVHKRLLIVNGLPRGYRDTLLLAAQASQFKHTWRVIPDDEPFDENASDEVLRRARAILDRDIEEFGSQFVTFLAEGLDDRVELLGCAAIRRAMSEGYRSRYWYIIHRALVLPQHQGQHFGLLLIPLTRISRHLAGEGEVAAAGFFIATRAKAIRHIVLRGLRTIPGRVMPLGLKPLATFDAPVDVGVFAGVAEWSDPIIAEARQRGILDQQTGELIARVQRVWWEGGDPQVCAWMGARLEVLRERLQLAAQEKPELAVHLDFLESAAAWQLLGPA